MTAQAETPQKTSVSTGCFFCTTLVENCKYRTKIWPQKKGNELAKKISAIIQLPTDKVPDRYLCRNCWQKVEKFSRLKEELKSCESYLLEMYNSSISRIKRCLPTDVDISPRSSSALHKKVANQSTVYRESSSRKQLSFETICPVAATHNILPDLTTAHANIAQTPGGISHDRPLGTICQVQVTVTYCYFDCNTNATYN